MGYLQLHVPRLPFENSSRRRMTTVFIGSKSAIFLQCRQLGKQLDRPGAQSTCAARWARRPGPHADAYQARANSGHLARRHPTSAYAHAPVRVTLWPRPCLCSCITPSQARPAKPSACSAARLSQISSRNFRGAGHDFNHLIHSSILQAHSIHR